LLWFAVHLYLLISYSQTEQTLEREHNTQCRYDISGKTIADSLKN